MNYNPIIGLIRPKEHKVLKARDLARIARIDKYYDYYENHYWKHIVAEFPEYSRDKQPDYTPTHLKFNWARFFVNRIAAYLFEETPGLEFVPFQIDKDQSEPEYKPSKNQLDANERAAQREELCYELWDSEHNDFALHLVEAARESELTGAVAAKLLYTDELRCIWRPRIEVFPIIDDDVDRINKIHFAGFEADEKTFWVQTYEMRTAEDGNKYCWLFEALYEIKDNIRDLRPKQVLYNNWMGNPNTKKALDFMPIELFPSDVQIGEALPETSPLMEDLIPMINEYSMKMSDAADSLRFEMFCIRALINVGEADLKKFQVGPGKLWKLASDHPDLKPAIESLQSNFSWRESLEMYLGEIIDAMHLIAHIIRLTPQEIKGLGTMSGVAITLLFSLTISMVKQKMKIWTPRLQRLNQKMLKMFDIYEPGDKEFLLEDGEYYLKNEVLPRLPIPSNKVEELDNAIKRLTNNLVMMKTVMNELGVENPEREIAGIIQEKKMWEEAFMNYSTQAAEQMKKEEESEQKAQKEKGL